MVSPNDSGPSCGRRQIRVHLRCRCSISIPCLREFDSFSYQHKTLLGENRGVDFVMI